MKRITLAALVAFGVLTNSPNVSADPLHDAVKAGDAESVVKLIEEGADINAPDQFGSPLHWAILKRNNTVAEVLIAHGALIDTSTDALGTPLHTATQRGHDEQVRFLLDHGANVDAHDKDEKTPLHYAAFYGQPSIARLLLKGGADVNARGRSEHGAAWGEGEFTALHIAVYREQSEVAELLRAAGAGPETTTPLDATLASGDAEAGRNIAKRCSECHVFEAGQSEPIASYAGPPLIGIVGKDVASSPGYEYSSTLRQMSGTWTEDRLFSFIRHPMLTAPGTRMVFERIDQERQIVDLIAFLKGQKP